MSKSLIDMVALTAGQGTCILFGPMESWNCELDDVPIAILIYK